MSKIDCMHPIKLIAFGNVSQIPTRIVDVLLNTDSPGNIHSVCASAINGAYIYLSYSHPITHSPIHFIASEY